MADRRKRQSRNKRGRGKRQWQLQQTKVTFRDIDDSSKFGTAKEILTMISGLIDKVNEQQQQSANSNNTATATAAAANANHLWIQLDQKSVDKIIEAEELVKAEEAKRIEESKAAVAVNQENDTADEETTEEALETKEPSIPSKTLAEIVKGPEVVVPPVEGPVITARALYVVPAKKSRRRGEKSGCAYIVLTAPPPPEPEKVVPSKGTHEVAEIVTPVEKNSVEKEVTVPKAEEGTAETVIAEGIENLKIAADVSEKKEEIVKKKDEAVDQPATTDTKKEANKEKMVDMKDASSVPLYTAAEKSRLTAVAKLQLLYAIDALSAVVAQDSCSTTANASNAAPNDYGNCQVAASVSGKAWRDKEGGHRDRREGTIETTGDYKQFFNKQTKAQEDRQNRPKPAPGGGLDGTTGDTKNDQPLSAIVLHLRAKHQEQNKRKKASKKASKDAKKGGKQPASSSSTSGGGGGSNKDGSRRSGNSKGGRRGRKDGKKSGSTQAPVMLMKSNHNGSGGG